MPRPLDYESPRPREHPQPVALLIVPVVATALNCGVGFHSGVVEPFGEFAVGDLLIQVGGPVVVVGLWAYWAVIAFRHGLRLAVAVPLALWAVPQILFTLWLGIGYFVEPWNW